MSPRTFASLVCLSTILLLIQPCDGGNPGEFEDTGSMVNGRSGHTATLLPNGKVLVAAGGGFSNAVATAELFDPGSGTWSATGSLAESRYSHSMTLLSDGNVLVAGGFFRGNNPIVPMNRGSAELYNPPSGIWTDADSVGGRGDHTATLLSNGKVLVAGGHAYSPYGLDPNNNTARLYDPASGTWSDTGNLVEGRSRHTATLLPNGKVLLVGGYNWAGSTNFASAELYDPATGTWSATGSLSHARSHHTATLLQNGKVLVAGGSNNGPEGVLNSAELYDPATGTWTPTGNLGTSRVFHTATLLASNRVMVAGGSTGSEALATAELYNPATGSWSSTGNLRHKRSGHTATLLPDKKVLLAGADDGDGSSAELYTEDTTPNLLNISTRLHVQAGDNAMIGGFIITGTERKTILIRGIGPSLEIPGALADPVIEVHGSSGQLLATNDNWNDADTRQQIIDSGLAPKHDSESALWGTIDPGSYTVIVKGKDNSTGLGLFEVYDLDQTADSRLANVATRGLVQTGDDILIGGFILGGGTEGGAATVIVRGLGPSIPVAGALADPTLELHDGSGTLVASNDNWKTRADGSSQQAEIEATTVPPSNELESALVRTLPAGNYSIVVRGANDTTGVALVDAYKLQ